MSPRQRTWSLAHRRISITGLFLQEKARDGKKMDGISHHLEDGGGHQVGEWGHGRNTGEMLFP